MARDCDQTEDGVNSNCFSSVLLGTNLSQKCFFFFLLLIVFFPPDQRATTATGVVTFPGTARSPKRRESSSATLAGKLVTWPVTAITPMSRSATPAVGLATSRSCAIR